MLCSSKSLAIYFHVHIKNNTKITHEIQLFMLTIIYYCILDIKYKFQNNLIIEKAHKMFRNLEIVVIFNFLKSVFQA